MMNLYTWLYVCEEEVCIAVVRAISVEDAEMALATRESIDPDIREDMLAGRNTSRYVIYNMADDRAYLIGEQ